MKDVIYKTDETVRVVESENDFLPHKYYVFVHKHDHCVILENDKHWSTFGKQLDNTHRAVPVNQSFSSGELDESRKMLHIKIGQIKNHEVKAYEFDFLVEALEFIVKELKAVKSDTP